MNAPTQTTGRFATGGRRSPFDVRDYRLPTPVRALVDLPDAVDLRPQFPPVDDQQTLASCTAHAVASAIRFDRAKTGESPDFAPSRLFLYYYARLFDNDVELNIGVCPRSVIRQAETLGVCPEYDWPYECPAGLDEDQPFPSGARAAMEPTDACQAEATAYDITSYTRPDQTLTDLQGKLAGGFPFIFVMNLYANWFGTDASIPLTTQVPMPTTGSAPIASHTVLAVGYSNGNFIFRSSWGEVDQNGNALGDKGYFYIPYDYVTNPAYAGDFWVINEINS